MSVESLFNSLPNGKFFDWSKFKAYADDKINANLTTEIFFGMARRHCGKRRKLWFPAFSLFPAMFSKAFFPGVVKTGDCVVKS